MAETVAAMVVAMVVVGGVGANGSAGLSSQEITAASASPRGATARSTDSTTEEITEERLSNGIRVVTERMPGTRSVTLGAWVSVGGRDEPANLAGASHFLEHLLFKGTTTRSARDIAQAIDAVGGEMNAFTAREHTAYYARLPADQVKVGLDVIGDVLTDPAFRPPEVDAERQVILEEILMNLDMPEDHVHSLLAEAMFPGHPLGREVLGTRDTVEVADRDDIAGFFGQWYLPRNLAVVAAGQVDHAQIVDTLEQSLGGLEGGARPERTAPSGEPEPLVVHSDETEQAHLALGWRAVDHNDDDRYALSVLNQVLGGGMSSRLFQEIREERGLCYSVYSWATTYYDSGSAGVYTATNPARLTELLGLIDAEVDKVLAEGISGEELTVAKGYLEGSLLLALEDSGSRMGRIGRALVSRDEVVSLDEQLTRLRAVTVDDVSRVATRVLGSPRSLAIVGPVDPSTLRN